MTIAYGIILAVAVVLLVLYCTLIRKKEEWLLVLYACVCIVNLGYLLLSLSKTVEFALLANKIAYLGHIFSLISMYLTIAKLCGFYYTKKLPILLFSLGGVVFAMVCTTGYLPWYYKSVMLEQADGATKLVKEYGPLHVVYLIYILAYFALMIATIIWSIHKKMVSSRKHAGLLTAVVLCNIAMWIIEKFVTWNFEFLSISYILSVGMLFFLYWMMQDYVHKNDIPVSTSAESGKFGIDIATIPMEIKIGKVLSRLESGETLAPREREVLELILQYKKRREIAEIMYVSESSVKLYTRTLYSKLGVTCREELYAILVQE